MKIIIMASLYLFSSLTYASFEVQKVTDNVYALVGELSQRSKTNLGNNSTHGVIITSKGVVLIDSGASYLGAKETFFILLLKDRQYHPILNKITPILIR
jgi:predicted acyltransferase (DUF342 family)